MANIKKISLLLIVLTLPFTRLLAATDDADAKIPKLTVLERTAEPLLKCDRPWEDFMISYFRVMRIGDQWHLWYNGHDHNFKNDNDSFFCYARSKDGVHWEKPSLGLYSYDGSTDNNIMTNGYNVGSVFLDENAPESERFKAVGVHMDKEKGNGWLVYGAMSPDGIHWQWLDEPLLAKNSDTAVVCIREDDIYRLYVRMWTGPGTWGGTRMVGYTESPTFGGFPDPEVILKPDEQDAPDFHLYNSAATKMRDDLYLMFPSGFFKKDGSLKVYAAYSRDGKHFERLGRKPLLDLGAGFDNKGLYVANGAIPAYEPDTYWFYYIGTTVPHDDNKPATVKSERGYGRFLLRVTD